MGSHPLNLALRFLLELVALAALGRWGWVQGEGVMRWVLAIGTPLVAATLWGMLNVAGDPSRSGRAPVPVPGWLRLSLEIAFFAAATWALYRTGSAWRAGALAGITLLHYLISYDRIAWLLSR